MLIVGAKGFAKEMLEIFHQLNQLESVYFYDDINTYAKAIMYDKFEIIQDISRAETLFNAECNKFVLGIGNPSLRYKLSDKFNKIGGKLTSLISPFSHIGNLGNILESGVNIMTGTVITNDIYISTGALINLNCTIGHDSSIGKYSELCPGVHVSGNCKIGDFTFIGTGTSILPGISIGSNVVVGAGSVVTKNIEDNCLVMGVPAIKVKEFSPLQL